jgi:hypothetical protein
MVGWSADSSSTAIAVTAATTATGRQRVDGSRPVGNNKGVAMKTSVYIGIHHCCWYQAAQIAPGTEPGRVM